jgi:hypothetical protein
MFVDFLIVDVCCKAMLSTMDHKTKELRDKPNYELEFIY